MAKKPSIILEPLIMYSYFIHHVGNKKELQKKNQAFSENLCTLADVRNPHFRKEFG